jgi:hypothetical protein
MTKGEFKTYTTAKLGITDSTALARAGTFIEARWRMIWNAANWRQSRYQQTVAVSAGTQDVTLDSNFDFPTAFRWAEAYEVLPVNDLNALAMNPTGYDSTGQVVGVIPLGKDSSGNFVLRLVSKPAESKNLLVLGKRKCVNLTSDSDSPLIPGVDECLCAFVMGDLYQWIRQMNRAQAFFAEAQALLAKMVEIEMAQTAEIRRIIPVEQVLENDAPGLWF